jgi:hypothetical protein
LGNPWPRKKESDPWVLKPTTRNTTFLVIRYRYPVRLPLNKLIGKSENRRWPCYAPNLIRGHYLSYLYINFDTIRDSGSVNCSRRNARRAQKEKNINGAKLGIYMHP